MEDLLCPWETSLWFFSENVPQLLYYSHIPSIIAALVLGTLVFIKNRSQIISKLLVTLLLIFTVWAVLAILLWATNRADVVMFWWSMVVLIEPVLYAIAFYLFTLFATGKYPGAKTNFAIGALFLPLIALLPTQFNLIGVNLFDCAAIEGPLATYYTYALEALFTLAILVVAVRRFMSQREKSERLKVVYFAIGLLIFLAAFTSGNIIGSLTGNWDAAQFGLFGMPIFIGFLTYLIVQYKAFNVKMFGAQALILALWLLIGSLLFVVKSDLSKIISLITLAISIGFGFMLIKSIKREIEQREYLEKISKELAGANDQLRVLDKQKNEFLSFASHDLKSPIALIKQFATLIYDGTYKEPQKVHETVLKIKNTADRAVNMVNTFLDLRKIEEGRMEYNFEKKNLVEFVGGITADFTLLAKQQKNIDITFDSSASAIEVSFDTNTLRQVIQNFLDNSLKYTEAGWIKVEIISEQKTVLIKISDSGLGMDKELLPILFGQFHRDPGVAKKIQGTGLGLYIAKQIVLAHHGDTWAESDGKGKGSQFYIRLPKA